MRGKVNDKDLVTIAPCETADLEIGDIVLAKIQGRRYQHWVLHLIWAIEAERFLIGSNRGRIDGWVSDVDILGKAIAIMPNLRSN
ncbi:MAG: hypothetical protein JO316_15995 [Abitibacteriaceae bacterium]|nr:hypothetical protein [Abditibacteriaceae bacterium]